MMYRKNRWNRKDMGGNKYRAKKVESTDGKFDSALEYKRWVYLKALEQNGEIKNLVRQVPYTLLPPQYDHSGKCIFREVKYVSDMEYDLPSGEHIVEDVKGIILPIFRLKQKLVFYFFGIQVKVVKSSRGGQWVIQG